MPALVGITAEGVSCLSVKIAVALPLITVVMATAAWWCSRRRSSLRNTSDIQTVRESVANCNCQKKNVNQLGRASPPML